MYNYMSICVKNHGGSVLNNSQLKLKPATSPQSVLKVFEAPESGSKFPACLEASCTGGQLRTPAMSGMPGMPVIITIYNYYYYDYEYSYY